ncbi:zinc finger BED domain-containing protein RICESLEEPER 2 [Sorghum bicolor]|uniref:zinc finger BED domain-containing protein RICESLEEPER 2 n=1 Tax=Sorghum bicolor TaxID=4558 RepID=UPI000B4255CD|nr:zinc finger BED domain-containing protein RICESLEEPER 2 [Sorghum bicolor]|eukprot:XP_021314613.1 zinc finger BED domain-containing protein RICESLEEPER 2 [Sorghum bicolor]
MFAEMLKSDVEHLRVGDTTTTVRPCSAWPLPAAYSRESSHEYLKHLGTSTTRLESCRPYARVASLAMNKYKEVFQKHDKHRVAAGFFDEVRTGRARMPADAVLPHELILQGVFSKILQLAVAGGLFNNDRCAAHVINLIVKDGLQAIDGVINNIRESVKYIRGSQSRKEKFEDIIEELGIRCRSAPQIDVANRWNSTYDMIQSAMPFKDAFLELKVKDSNYTYCPSSQDWQRANAVCKLLKVFKKATKVVSGSTYPTSNLYFHQIWSVRQVLEEEAFSPNETIAAMVLEMQAKFDKYWMISYLTNCVPVVLDPRFKFGFIEFRLKQAFGQHGSVHHLDKVDQAIRGLFNAYATQMGGSSHVETHGDDMTSVDKGHSWSDWSEHISAKRNHANSEYDRYLRDDLFPCDDDSFDILNWWKMHASKYPTLAAMARDILAVTASTVPSESAFSTGGRIINDHRTRLAGSTVEALLCFQDWLRAAGSSYLDIISIDNFDSSSNELYQ